MRVLFVMRHSGYVRNFESTLRALCDGGHKVHLAFQGKVKYAQLDPAGIATQLAEQYPNFSSGDMPPRADGWAPVGRELRRGLDYLRYLTAEYRNAPKLRGRAERDAPNWLLDWTAGRFRGTALGRWATALWLRALHRAIPPDPSINQFLTTLRPDVLLMTPLIEPGSPQAEYVRSARALGIRTAFCVASWDNLSNKGLIHGPVDLVTVWNEAMKREAVRLHGVPAARVVVTGAPAFDHWFDWKPRFGRDEWCGRVGLPADRPYLLYLCSSKFIAPEEVPFVRRWVEAIRGSASPVVREAGILIRPHPQNAEQWRHVDMAAWGPVSLWPAAGAAPVDVETRSEYFDSMYHSAAVVGINTTAEIESAILGRRVYTVLAPEFRDTQEGTLHFHHLRQVNGGLLRVAQDLDEHVAQIGDALRDPQSNDKQCRGFVEAFVRPHGLDTAATPRLVDALETLDSTPAPRPVGPPAWSRLVRSRLDERREWFDREARANLKAQEAKESARALKVARERTKDALRRAETAEKGQREAAQRERRLREEWSNERTSVDGVAGSFRNLGIVRRRRVLRAVVDAIPPASFIELCAATRPGRLDYPHADIYLRTLTRAERFRLRACAKEPFTVDWIHTHVRAGDVLYDIGANVGAYSLVAAKQPGGGARVYSFEASLATVASLCANIVINGVSEQVTPMPIALSAVTGMNVFSLRDLEAGAARHSLGDEPPEDGPTMYRQPVMMFRLDDVVERFGLQAPNHIKMDVDGGELDVLEGASRTLASPALRSMLVEVSTSLSGAVVDIIQRHGLHLQSKTSVKNKAGEYLVWYGLFTRDAPGAEEATEG